MFTVGKKNGDGAGKISNHKALFPALRFGVAVTLVGIMLQEAASAQERGFNGEISCRNPK
jgi:hypothetical protein